MSGTDENVKHRILAAAVELLRREQDADRVSIRAIAERAGVSVGMANYHFRTKDNLIEEAVQSYIAGVIRGADPDAPPEPRSAAQPPPPETTGAARRPSGPGTGGAERMRQRLRAASGFVAAHPGISRVSIMRDMHDGRVGDNSSEVADGVYGQLRSVLGYEPDEQTVWLLAFIQVAAVQHFFLRADVVREKTGLDFFEETDRNRMMDLIVDAVLGRRAGPDTYKEQQDE